VEVDVWDLLIDDANRDHMHEHGVSVAVAFEILDDDPRALPNHVADGAALLLVGQTSIGMVTMPIDPTHEFGLWRPRTAYPSKPADIQRYGKMGKRK
jgi:hypothetical protein